jgi:hypothetical protein
MENFLGGWRGEGGEQSTEGRGQNGGEIERRGADVGSRPLCLPGFRADGEKGGHGGPPLRRMESSG